MIRVRRKIEKQREKKMISGADWQQFAEFLYILSSLWIFIRLSRQCRKHSTWRNGQRLLLHLSANLTQLKCPPSLCAFCRRLHLKLPIWMCWRAERNRLTMGNANRMSVLQVERQTIPYHLLYPSYVEPSWTFFFISTFSQIKWEKDTASTEMELK